MKNLKFGWAIPLALLTLMTWIDHAKAVPPLSKASKVYIEMLVGDTVTIAEVGPLRLYAECTQPAASKILSISVTSTSGGWFVASNGTSLSANDIHTYASISRESNPFWAELNAAPAASPGSAYLTARGGLGVNMLGFDCIFVGRFMAVQGP